MLVALQKCPSSFIGCLGCFVLCLTTDTALSQSAIPTEQRNSADEPEMKSLWTRAIGNDWPGFLGPNRDGKSKESGILKDWSDGKLKVVWTIATGQGYGIGSVSRGRYFHFDRVKDLARLRCLNAESGDQIWEFTFPSRYQDLYGYDSGPRTSPVVDGQRVYIFGVTGKLYCLNASDGSEIWNVDTGKRFGVVQNFFGVGSTPTIFKDQLLVMVGGTDGKQRVVAPNRFPDIKAAKSAVVSFNKFTGKFNYELGEDLASYSSIKLVENSDKDTAIVWARENLLGFDPSTQQLLFEFPWRARSLESVNASTPVVDNNFIFVSECYGKGSSLVQLSGDRSSVKQIWSDDGKRQKSMATHWNTPVLHQGYLYGSSGRHSGDAKFRCVEFETGKVKWSQPGLARASATFVDGHLLVLGEYGQLVLVKADPTKYKLITEIKPEDGIKLTFPCWAAPIVSHGLMIVRGKKKVVCYDLIPE